MDRGPSPWACLLLNRFPLLVVGHQLEGLNRLRVLYRRDVMRSKLLSLVQLVVSNEVASFDHLSLIRKLLWVPLAQAFGLDHLDLGLVTPRCYIIDVDLEFLGSRNREVCLRHVGLLQLLLKQLLIDFGNILGNDLGVGVRSLSLSDILAHVLLLVAEIVHLLHLVNLLLLHVAARTRSPIVVCRAMLGISPRLV